MRKGISVIITLFVLCTILPISAMANSSDPNNGDWSAKTITLSDTEEAELMVRTGDIDNVGFGFDQGYNPFTAEETSRHGYPWEPDDTDPDGTDRITLGSSFQGGSGADGYSEQYGIDPDSTKPRPITLEYDTTGLDVENALLQVYIDDFQAIRWGSKFTVMLNGKVAPYMTEIINAIEQTGPIAYIISVEIPPAVLPEIASGKVVLEIDDTTTGVGDGYAIDFVKLLINYNESKFKGTVSGTVLDWNSGKPVAGATVRVLGTSTTVVTDENGTYNANVIAGINVVRASKDGYVQNYVYDVVPAGKTVTFDKLYLREGTGEADIDYYSFIRKEGWSKASDWATSELQKAYESGLIPERLVGTDLTEDITRAEFAAVSVKLYEVLSEQKTKAIQMNPFSDTTDGEVLKAYNLGVVKGISATTFEPETLLNREQAATMLARVIAALYSDVDIVADGANRFADDADISDWAKPSVYFMAKNKIISGIGNNRFAPRNTTTAEAAAGYANTTREQALLIAVRSLEQFKNRAIQPSPSENGNTLHVRPKYDEPHRTTATIDEQGGELKATDVKGIQYVLTVPQDALMEPVTIELVPVESIEGLPMTGGLHAAVKMLPDGLRFNKEVELKIYLPEAIQAAAGYSLTGFTYKGDGEDAHLYPITLSPDRTQLTLSLLHFSGYGGGGATEAEATSMAEQTPSSWEGQLINDLYESGEDTERGLEVARIAFYDHVLPVLEGAVINPDRFEDALFVYSSWGHYVLILRGQEHEELLKKEFDLAKELLGESLKNGLIKAETNCYNNKDPEQVVRMLELGRYAALLGYDDKVGDLMERVKKCLRFEVKVHSELVKEDHDGMFFHYILEGQGILDETPTFKFMTGTLDYEFTKYEYVVYEDASRKVAASWDYKSMVNSEIEHNLWIPIEGVLDQTRTSEILFHSPDLPTELSVLSMTGQEATGAFKGMFMLLLATSGATGEFDWQWISDFEKGDSPGLLGVFDKTYTGDLADGLGMYASLHHRIEVYHAPQEPKQSW